MYQVRGGGSTVFFFIKCWYKNRPNRIFQWVKLLWKGTIETVMEDHGSGPATQSVSANPTSATDWAEVHPHSSVSLQCFVCWSLCHNWSKKQMQIPCGNKSEFAAVANANLHVPHIRRPSGEGPNCPTRCWSSVKSCLNNPKLSPELLWSWQFEMKYFVHLRNWEFPLLILH